MKNISLPVLEIVKNINSKTKLMNKNNFNKSLIAVQHNNLVQAKYSMTLQQKRIMMWLVSQIKPDDVDFKEHTLSVKELIDVCHLSGESAYKEIRNITFSLIEKGIRIVDITNSKKDMETQISWLLSAKYCEGRVTLTFSPELKPYLLSVKNQFTTINITDIMMFKSVYAIRIYELLKQYQNIGERVLSIQEIKDCCGVSDKLTKYSDFEKKIILISQREINQKSDICFEFERIKNSRKIVAIKFKISKNKIYELKNNPKSSLQETKRKSPAYEILRDFGLSAKMTNTLIKENTDETIRNAVRAVDIQISKGTVRNPKAMLLTAIKDKWHPDIYKPK